MKATELAKFAEGMLALVRRRKGDDAVGRPLIGAEGRRLRIVSDKGQLFEVVVVELLDERVDDLAGTEVSEDVDDLAVL